MIKELDWLVVGALGAEVLPLFWEMAGLHALGPRLHVGRVAGQRIGVLRCGVGPERAERRTRRALERLSVSRVVSIGTCGGLVDDLAIGEVVTADRLLWDTRPLRSVSPLGSVRRLGCATVSRPVQDVATRQRLAGAGAGVCEMEAAAVARAAGDRSFFVLKIVSDLAGSGPDTVFSSPRPVAIARFNLRALRLSRDGLIPALVRCLQVD